MTAGGGRVRRAGRAVLVGLALAGTVAACRGPEANDYLPGAASGAPTDLGSLLSPTSSASAPSGPATSVTPSPTPAAASPSG